MWLAIYKPRKYSLSWIANWVCSDLMSHCPYFICFKICVPLLWSCFVDFRSALFWDFCWWFWHLLERWGTSYSKQKPMNSTLKPSSHAKKRRELWNLQQFPPHPPAEKHLCRWWYPVTNSDQWFMVEQGLCSNYWEPNSWLNTKTIITKFHIGLHCFLHCHVRASVCTFFFCVCFWKWVPLIFISFDIEIGIRKVDVLPERPLSLNHLESHKRLFSLEAEHDWHVSIVCIWDKWIYKFASKIHNWVQFWNLLGWLACFFYSRPIIILIFYGISHVTCAFMSHCFIRMWCLSPIIYAFIKEPRFFFFYPFNIESNSFPGMQWLLGQSNNFSPLMYDHWLGKNLY